MSFGRICRRGASLREDPPRLLGVANVSGRRGCLVKDASVRACLPTEQAHHHRRRQHGDEHPDAKQGSENPRSRKDSAHLLESLRNNRFRSNRGRVIAGALSRGRPGRQAGSSSSRGARLKQNELLESNTGAQENPEWPLLDFFGSRGCQASERAWGELRCLSSLYRN